MSIYFDNAASTPISKEVLQDMMPYLTDYFGNPSSIHQDGRKVKTAIESARKQVAKILNASIGEIFFTSGGTESNNTALKSSVESLDIQRIITSELEHPAILNTINQLQKRHPIEIVYVNHNEIGQIDFDHLELLLKKDNIKTLVSLMHGNNEIGNLLDLDRVSHLCETYNAYFHTDAVQTVGHFNIDLQKTKIHFLSASAHKFHGPKGIGILYINSEIQIDPLINGGGQERNMRGGTENVAYIVGLASALTYYNQNLIERSQYILDLKKYFIQSLDAQNIDYELNGSVDQSLYTVLSLSFPRNAQSDMLLMLLDIDGVSVSGGSACSSGAEKASHVINAIHKNSNRRTIRFSFSHYNTKSEIDTVIKLLKKYL